MARQQNGYPNGTDGKYQNQQDLSIPLLSHDTDQIDDDIELNGSPLSLSNGSNANKPISKFCPESDGDESAAPDSVRYQEIEKFVGKKYDDLFIFLDNHSDPLYRRLGARLDKAGFIRVMTNKQYNQGILHTRPPLQQSILNWIIPLGKFSQWEELFYCLLNYYESVKGTPQPDQSDTPEEEPAPLWARILLSVPTAGSIPPNSWSINPKDDAEEIVIGDDYKNFKIKYPKNENEVKFFHHALDLLEKKGCCDGLSRFLTSPFGKLLVSFLQVSVVAGQTYSTTDYLNFSNLATNLFTALFTLSSAYAAYKGKLGTILNYLNVAWILGAFAVTAFWGSAAQGIAFVELIFDPVCKNWLSLSPSNKVRAILITPVYVVFVASGFTYYVLQAGKIVWKGAFTFWTSKNPFWQLWKIDPAACIEILIKDGMNWFRRGAGMAGIGSDVITSFRYENEILQAELEKITMSCATTSTMITRNTGASDLLIPYTINLFGYPTVIPTKDLLNLDGDAQLTKALGKFSYKKHYGLSLFSISLGSCMGVGIAYFAYLFSENNLTHSLIWGPTLGLIITALNLWVQKFRHASKEARKVINNGCGHEEEAERYQRAVRYFTEVTLFCDILMRLFGITGLIKAISFLGGYDPTLMKYALYTTGVATALSERQFLKERALKGTQKLLNEVRKETGCHIYVMQMLPDPEELKNYKDTYIFHDHIGDGVTLYHAKENDEQEVELQPQRVPNREKVEVLIGQLPRGGDDSKPIYTKQGAYFNFGSTYKCFGGIPQSKIEQLIAITEKAKPADAEQPEDKEESQEPRKSCCSRVTPCDVITLGLSRVFSGLFTHVVQRSLRATAIAMFGAQPPPTP